MNYIDGAQNIAGKNYDEVEVYSKFSHFIEKKNIERASRLNSGVTSAPKSANRYQQTVNKN